MNFTGLSAFPITPATRDGRVQTDALVRVLERLRRPELGSVGLLGSTGTFAYLTPAERRRAVSVAADVLGGSVSLMVGAGALRTDEACALARNAAEAGANAVLLPAVSYTPLTQDEAFAHYSAVAAASDLPLCIYNNPSTTHFNFDIALIQRLAQIPRIAAIKMPLPAQDSLASDLARLRSTLPADFAIGYSGDWGCAEALLAGADTWYSVIGGILPDIALRLTAAAKADNAAEARRINEELAPLWTLFKVHGSLRVVYAMARQMGLADCDPPRPILPLDDATCREIAAATEPLACYALPSQHTTLMPAILARVP